jgi:two-component system, OmpR family, KDP operon response regulator KdpE
MEARVLIVDDEPQILRALQTTLRGAGYDVTTAATAKEALAAAAVGNPEAVILDLVLPDGRGTDVARELRGWSSAPIIVLSAVGDEHEKVAALDAGADDYVTKPFGADELMARLRAALRHRLAQQGAERTFASGDFSVDLVRRLVRRGPEDVRLSPKEYDILEQLVIHAGKVLTHKHLLREVWRDESVDPQYLRVYVRQLRQKIEVDPSSPRHVLTEPGIGYRLV